jgi:Domain of unknown function (DUF5664)
MQKYNTNPQEQLELGMVVGEPRKSHYYNLPKTLGEAVGIAVKYDQDKAPLSLLSNEALVQTARVLAFGKEKYAAHNWRNGFEWSRPLSAALRHILAFQDGEDRDPESGLSHLAHAMCCIMFLLEFEKTHRELDDRWKPETK